MQSAGLDIQKYLLNVVESELTSDGRGGIGEVGSSRECQYIL